MKDKILLVDSSAEHRGFFSTINLTLLTLLYCKKNNIQPIIGTTNLDRIKEICKGSDIIISRKEWYDIYKSAGNILP